MSAFAASSYAAAALGFFLLTILLWTSWRGRRQGAHLIVACTAAFLWASVLATQHLRADVPVIAVYVAEIVRDAAWLLALMAIAEAAAPKGLVFAVRVLLGASFAAAILAPLLESLGVLVINPTFLLSRAGLLLSLAALVLLEQIFRNSSHSARRSLRYFALGVGMVFSYDLFLYSQTEIMGGLSVEAWSARGVVNALAVPLIAIAARRNPDWSLDVFVSRHAVFYTATFIVVGAYLTVAALGGYYVRQAGGEWGSVGQIVFFAGAVVALASLMTSTTLRRYARVFINKHFYRNKYDYRIEWLRFIATLSSTEEVDVRRTAVRAIAQVFNSPGGILFIHDENDDRFVPHAAWPMRIDAVPALSAMRADDDVPRFLARKQWIIDAAEMRRTPELYENIEAPAWLLANPGLRIVSPLLQLDRLVGFVVLYEPPAPFELTYEDRDLLKTLGRHVATHVAQYDADRKLAEGRQFEAYNRLTAFMMHDLKNSVAQLKLIVANAERHKRNPEFIDDAIGTIANAVDRMTRLIEQLRGSAKPDRLDFVDLADVVREAVARCAARRPQPLLRNVEPATVRADQEKLTSVIEHIIRNAQDATGETGAITVEVAGTAREAMIAVTDTGSGMDAAFVRDRLFRPFDSTKGAKGMGIGAYQVREYVRSLGGTVEVQSSPGQGTRFAVNLPLSHRSAAAITA